MSKFYLLLLGILSCTLLADSALPFSFGNRNGNIPIGALLSEIKPTPLSKGTKFVSPSGYDVQCSRKIPCTLDMVVEYLNPGDVVFLRGGTYYLKKRLSIHKGHSGTEAKPIIIESYPGEHAVIDGNQTLSSINTGKGDIYIHSWADHIHFRKLEIKNMSKQGLMLGGSHNLIEGCVIHHNHLSGITLYDDKKFNQAPFVHGYNIIRHNIVYHNSDAGLLFAEYNDGDNADGISISSGKYNKVFHNSVYNNSDDGIDTWLSNDTEVAFNLVYHQGLSGKNGNGNGIKAGGNLDQNATNGSRAYIHHNISCFNHSNGFNVNAGKKVKLISNTAYMNSAAGFSNIREDTLLLHNLSVGNKLPEDPNHFTTDNLSIKKEKTPFLDYSPGNPDFLRPKKESGLSPFGVYSDTPR